jgi:hypothetical protein
MVSDSEIEDEEDDLGIEIDYEKEQEKADLGIGELLQKWTNATDTEGGLLAALYADTDSDSDSYGSISLVDD